MTRRKVTKAQTAAHVGLLVFCFALLGATLRGVKRGT
jgi:hypothetical protein